MKTAPNNPVRNVLGSGVIDAQVIAAVEHSGYPLQTRVAEKLSDKFHVREEWSYVDRDTGILRAIDMNASKTLYASEDGGERVRPKLQLIVECKKSDLPFVFFASRHRAWIYEFPLISGLNSKRIECITDDDLSTWTFDLLHVLNLYKHDFCQKVFLSNTFSKCVWAKSSELNLSGEEAYNSVILPLIKAVNHFDISEKPKSTHYYFDVHLVVPIAVIDAPMIYLELIDGESVETLIPWVRVARHEYDKNNEDWHKDRLFAIDFVHVDFLGDYLEKHLLPFAEEFGKRALAHPGEVADGLGFISGLGVNSFNDLESRLRPRPIRTKLSRLTASIFRILIFPWYLIRKDRHF